MQSTRDIGYMAIAAIVYLMIVIFSQAYEVNQQDVPAMSVERADLVD